MSLAWDGLTLVFDGSTSRITVALLRDGVVIGDAAAERTTAAQPQGPAEQLAGLTASLLGVVDGERPRRVVIGSGPGSFTGLRAAAAFAKGLSHGASLPLLAVPSLALAAAEALGAERAASDGGAGGGPVIVALDALRGESFVQRFEHADGAIVRAGPVSRVPTASLPDACVGPGRARDHAPHARALPAARPLAEPVDRATWEPAYGRLAEAEVQRARAAAATPA